MLASVVIPTRNRRQYVADAVESVFNGEHPDFELFVVDQSADNETESALRRFSTDSRFHYVKNVDQNIGASRSRNIGIALSTGEIVANIDDDVVARLDFLKSLVAEFEADPELGFVIGSLTAPEYDRTKGFVPEFRPDSSISAWRLPLVSAGANYCMRRNLFDSIGGYDECWGPGSKFGVSDDGDICFRIIRSGAKWKVCPGVEVVHLHGFRDIGVAPGLMRAYDEGVGANFGRFMRRGDIRAGIWFLMREVRQAARAAAISFRDGSDVELRHVGYRLAGFGKGFMLPPNTGFVTPAALNEMRDQFTPIAASSGFRFSSAPGTRPSAETQVDCESAAKES